jgi:hypothetical protein
MEIRNLPCGNCNCGVYSEMALLNPYARELGSYSEEERFTRLKPCKLDPDKICAGEYDYHTYLIQLDAAHNKIMGHQKG